VPVSFWNFINVLSFSQISKTKHNEYNLYFLFVGFIGGEFIKRSRIPKPGQEVYTSEPPVYFGPQDFYVGNTLILYGFEFLLLEADEYTLRYMEVSCQEASVLWIRITLSSLFVFICNPAGHVLQ
jgi:hypothetical protein